jgi:predicted regulator of Ras-like GTPase activity (Roadblock/LC7/MglB family)
MIFWCLSLAVESQLNFLLRELMKKIEGIKSSALVTREGLLVTAILEEGVSENHIAALSAIILSTCEKVLIELKKGELDICIIQGTEGKFIVMGCGNDNIIVSVLNQDARMDLAFVNMRATVNRMLDLLQDQ